MNRPAHFGSCLACIASHRIAGVPAPKGLAGTEDLDEQVLSATMRSLVWIAGFAAGVRIADLPVGPEGLLCEAHCEAFAEYLKAFDAHPLHVARAEEHAVELATDAEQALTSSDVAPVLLRDFMRRR